MPRPAAPRFVIPHHARQGAEVTGAVWGMGSDAVRIGVVDRYTERDVSMPSHAVAPHFSLVLLVEGQGHFLMGDSDAPCEFRAGHCLLSCGWEPFDGEDFIPAHAHFRAVLMHYPLSMRAVTGGAPPVSHGEAEVYPHPHAHAWLARLPMEPWMLQLAQELVAHGLPTAPLALLEVQCRALQALHAVARHLTEGGAPTPAQVESTHPPPPDGSGLAGRDRRRLLEARRFIEVHLAEPLRLADVASACGMNATALKQGFRQMFGTSVHALVLDSRCEQAAQLLRRTDLAIKEVARQCGFSSTSHLARHFLPRHGLTPLRYRQAHPR